MKLKVISAQYRFCDIPDPFRLGRSQPLKGLARVPLGSSRKARRCKNEVDTTQVNTSPVLCFMEVENKRSADDYQKELTKATNKVIGMYRK